MKLFVDVTFVSVGTILEITYMISYIIKRNIELKRQTRDQKEKKVLQVSYKVGRTTRFESESKLEV